MIQQKSTEIADFSERAREIERLMRSSTQEREALDLVPVIERELEEVREGYLGVDLEADLPETAEVEASPLVESAIDNLVENAVEHNDKPTAQVEVILDPHDGGYYFEVDDNGPGLPAYERRLLEGGEETKLKHSDGIGLWLVNWIVEESNGWITVEDSEGSGARIAVWLPSPSGEREETEGIDYSVIDAAARSKQSSEEHHTRSPSPEASS
jgi:signal transduction histidine kinase